MGTDKGENSEIEEGIYSGQDDRGPIWLVIGALLFAAVGLGAYMYHAERADAGRPPAQNQTVGATSSPAESAGKGGDNQQALPSAQPAINPYGGNNNAGSSQSGTTSSSTY